MENSFRIYWLKETDSTNEEALRRISDASGACDNMSVLVAESQTSGKGQGDHKWHSKPGDNLTFSVVLKYGEGYGNFHPFQANRQKEISDAVAESIVDYLALYGIEAWVKPPNDIWVGNRKICGLLIRHRVCGTSLLYTIIGIGLNINEESFPNDLPNPTSLRLITGQKTKYNLHSELERILGILDKRLDSLLG